MPTKPPKFIHSCNMQASPRGTKARTHDTVFALLGQERRGKPWRLSWAASIKKSFGVDPLLDGQGDRMRWRARLEPIRRR